MATRVCVIGCGPIGNLHARIYAELGGAGSEASGGAAVDAAGGLDLELAGVCDIDPRRARACGESRRVPWFTSVRDMLTAVSPRIVSVATGGFEYSSDHHAPTMEALEADCHVLCEKPISNDIGKAAEMVARAREKGLCLGVNLNHRFTPAARIARTWVEEGRLGPLLFANMSLWIGKPQDEPSPWFHLKALNPHSVDMLRYYCGDITQVQCFAMKAPGRTLWSTASFNFRFANGMVGHLTSSYDISRGHPMERCEVAGLKGRFVVDDMWREATLYPAGDPVKSVYTNPVFGGYGSFDDTFRERIACFARQVIQGASPREIDGSGADGLEAQRVIQAGIESVSTGRVVEVATVR
jgi:predicted dehydrogenase